ncbi:thiol:disulfide interchange protein DsbC [Neiella marina]|uniref:Thiol:disulfide interchange protein n=1 Tax=Neiella marina TaxID=508461 RepID=A0A8J2XRW5_9GAMM|nr:thioredoxin fold domain-containing protein [Neiella marina]GGA90684.1 thiol:disulfide interchange protein DsbC [Neiella marina]
MLKWLSALSAIVLSVFVVAHAADVSPDVEKRVKAKVLANFGEVPSMIAPAPLPNYTLAVTSQGNFFISNDGKYMIYGRLFDLEQGLVEITDSGLNSFRAEKIGALAPDAITFPAKGEEKFRIYVFTDITCGYCRKMHRQIEEYQNAGITINYLAYPRSKQSSVDMQQIWCADDAVQAMSNAKLHGEIAKSSCAGKRYDVEAQLAMGQKFGVRGTPAVVLENGAMLPGYREPKDLLPLLEKLQ